MQLNLTCCHIEKWGCDVHDLFELWFQQQEFYIKLVYIHGKSIFFRDNDIYRLLVVQIGYEAWLEGRQCNQAI